MLPKQPYDLPRCRVIVPDSGLGPVHASPLLKRVPGCRLSEQFQPIRMSQLVLHAKIRRVAAMFGSQVEAL